MNAFVVTLVTWLLASVTVTLLYVVVRLGMKIRARDERIVHLTRDRNLAVHLWSLEANHLQAELSAALVMAGETMSDLVTLRLEHDHLLRMQAFLWERATVMYQEYESQLLKQDGTEHHTIVVDFREIHDAVSYPVDIDEFLQAEADKARHDTYTTVTGGAKMDGSDA